ncbi:MAG: acetoacetate decarboxylase family protein [Deltaproteobacteria bacterium]|jgi:hypothetical protein|nr:acetoacetate decarboxylase family protein [Deltaproteobacteria bacterium]
MSPAEPVRYEIQGQQVSFPVEVRDASGAIAVFLVSSRAANRLVGDAFEVVEFLPGRTLFMLGCIDYKDNDLGDYNEVAMNFPVRKKGAPRGLPWIGAWLAMAKGDLASYSWRMPVDQSFTRDAGATIWGFPKTIERIDFDYSREGRFHGYLEMDGEKVFEIQMPRGGNKERPESPMIGYSYIEGVPHLTRSTQTASQMGASGGKNVEITLGSHPVADDLRSLGLPKKPLMITWIGKMVMRFGPPEKL